ncbi:RDD family protein [Streptomyces bohaiensis]|uniref:RDD family protein n=1 Tax=Streptomyces bohaiensis TaxID=1431344 RepID=UPI003B78710F
MSGLVTGDAVVLGLRPARLPSRAMAIAIDVVLIVGVYLLVSLVLASSALGMGEAALSAVEIATLVLMLIGVPVAVETLTRGRSLGKLVLGLRVVRDDGGPVRFRHALVRGLVGFVELFVTMGFVAMASSLVSPLGRRLGDVFAGTMVVRERIPVARASLLPPPPPELAGGFARLDLSRVPEELWLAVRQLLVRLPKLEQRVAWSMSVRLAEDLAALVGTPPPEGMHPSAYLAAVAGERQRRDAQRAFGDRGPAATVGIRWTAAAPGTVAMPAAPAGPPAPGTAPAVPFPVPPAPSSAPGAPGAQGGAAGPPDDASPATGGRPGTPAPGGSGDSGGFALPG